MLSLFRSAVAAVLVAAMVPSLIAQAEGKSTPEGSQATPEAAQEPQLTAEQEAAEFLKPFAPQTGTIDLGGVAEIKLEAGWQWIDGLQGQRLLREFGNEMDPSVRGVALPPDFATSNIFAVYTISDDGHIEDEEPDYDELLEQMKEQTVEGSKARKQAGMGGVELMGWAEPPHYDKQDHKLYWAKELMFEGSPTATLNYNVRVLGRTSNIEINGVGDIGQLQEVDQHCKKLLRATEFTEGKRYSDFDPEYDKIAAYGIGGLIAGKIALKVGLFAKLGIFLLKFLKPLLVGLAVVGGILVKVFGGRKKQPLAAGSAAETMPPIEDK
tara:strand:- start:41987 stop:42961 length:975 start_codon:yes stop_codon:yes gene_type:complete